MRLGSSKEDADDFAQFCAMKWLEGRLASTPNLYIDFLRQNRVDPRSSNPKRALMVRWSNENLEQFLSTDEHLDRMFAMDSLNEIRSALSKVETLVLDMMLDGMAKTTIAGVLGVSGGAISYRWRKIVAKATAHIGKEGTA